MEAFKYITQPHVLRPAPDQRYLSLNAVVIVVSLTDSSTLVHQGSKQAGMLQLR
jgi:hypothetical protein